MNEITVLGVRPGKEPEMVEIPDDLNAMQEFVGGYIEAVRPWGDDVALLCDEEAVIKGAELNRIIMNENGGVFGVISGPFFLCLAPRNSGVLMSLPNMMADRYKTLLAEVPHE